jgi:DNA-binding CsgD family transcriptional regulator
MVVLWCMAQHQTHEEIAAQEFLSVRSVRRTIHDLQRKLDAPTTFLLGVRAAQYGLISEPAERLVG